MGPCQPNLCLNTNQNRASAVMAEMAPACAANDARNVQPNHGTKIPLAAASHVKAVAAI